MALSPDSPRFSVISASRAPSLRLRRASTPPCSSSGCAVVCITLAVVRAFRIFCHAPAAPASCTGTVWAYGSATTNATRAAAAINTRRIIVTCSLFPTVRLRSG